MSLLNTGDPGVDNKSRAFPRMDKKGLYSKEKLIHFNCYKCSKWWSIGDIGEKDLSLFCPWCGEKQEFYERQ